MKKIILFVCFLMLCMHLIATSRETINLKYQQETNEEHLLSNSFVESVSLTFDSNVFVPPRKPTEEKQAYTKETKHSWAVAERKTAPTYLQRRKTTDIQAHIDSINNTLTKNIDRLKPHIETIIADTDAKKQITCIAKNVYYEARGESVVGQAAVASVTMNRAKQSNLNPCQVVYQKNNNVCQFSWVCQIASHHLSIKDKDRWCESLILAYLTYFNSLEDVTSGATHFYNPQKASPRWANDYPPIVNKYTLNGHIGNHKFFNGGYGS